MFEIKDIQIDTINPLRRTFSIAVAEFICNDDGKVIAIKQDDEGNNKVHRRAFAPGQFDRVVDYLESQGMTDELQKKLVMDAVNVLWPVEIVEAYREWEMQQAIEENNLIDAQLNIDKINKSSAE